jgi:hypothetical protein
MKNVLTELFFWDCLIRQQNTPSGNILAAKKHSFRQYPGNNFPDLATPRQQHLDSGNNAATTGKPSHPDSVPARNASSLHILGGK